MSPKLLSLKNKENTLILLFGALLAVIIIATSVVSAFFMRENAHEEWVAKINSLSLVLTEQTSQTLYSANGLLEHMHKELSQSQIETEKHYVDFVSKESQYRFLTHEISGNPLITVAAYLDRDGRILNYSRKFPAPDISVRDRDYFLQPLTTSGNEVYFSAPVKNRTDDTWVFYLSKKVLNKSGEFLGMVVVGISSEIFSSLYKNIVSNLGAGTSISLYRKDFTLLSRWPNPENKLAQVDSDSPAATLILGQHQASGDTSVEIRGVKSFVSARVVRGYPFVVVVEVAGGGYEHNWFANERWLWILGGSSLLILGLSVYFLIRYNTRLHQELDERRIAQRELTKAHTMLEGKVQERTQELTKEITERKEAQEELSRLNSHIAEVSHRAGMAEVANSVIHNVGNALNSVNIGVTTMRQHIRSSPLTLLPKIADLINEHKDHLAAFLTQNEKGEKLPRLIEMLSDQWKIENATLMTETDRLQESVDHIRQIVNRQQSLSGTLGVDEHIKISDLIANCLNLYVTNFKNAGVIVSLNNEPDLEWNGDKNKLSQILLNLIMNSEESLVACENTPKTLKVSSLKNEHGIQIEVADNGLGIEPDALKKMFSYGFTTKPQGHGLGLHASAIAANELGGNLQAFSAGRNQGAVFVLTLPEKSDSTE